MFDTLDATQATAVLGAMTTVIEPWPRGEPTLGRKLVAAAADLLFGLDPDRVDAMPVAPDRLRVALDGRNEATVKHVAELIAVAALVDGRVAADRVRVALDHARHLGVRAPWVGELSDVADGHLDRAMHEMVIRNSATFPGLSVPGTEPDLLPYDGRSDADRRLHARFEDLEGFPDGSYGRAFWVHFRRHGFRFPGQDGAFNGAFAVPHDALHVLTGYDTSMQGEVLVSTFTGRMHRRDALSAHLLPVIFQWHAATASRICPSSTGPPGRR